MLTLGVLLRAQESRHIFRGKLDTQGRAQMSSMPSWRRSSLKSPSAGDSVSASIPAACARSVKVVTAEVAGRIVVARDIEAAKRCREEKGGEVIGGERGDHGQVRQSASQRQHGLEALAGRHDIGRDTEADAVPEQMTHGAPRRVDGSLVVARRVEPGAMRAGDVAGEVGDGGDQCRPDLGRRVGIGPIIAARVKAQRGECRAEP